MKQQINPERHSVARTSNKKERANALDTMYKLMDNELRKMKFVNAVSIMENFDFRSKSEYE